MENSINIPAMDSIKAERCRRSFFYFIQEFWNEVIPEEPVWNWHIEYIAGELQKLAQTVVLRDPKKADMIINIPPGTSKSTVCTVMFPAWCWVIDPTLRILTASYSAALSTDHAVKSRDIIKCDRFQSYFPHIVIKKDQDNKMHFKNEAGGERYVTSVGGTVTGFHAHLIIVDDPINPKESLSVVARESAKDFMDRTLSTRKVDKEATVTILIMQRLHADDPSGSWLNRPGKSITHICLPGELSEDVKPEELRKYYVSNLLDPVRLSRLALDGLRTDLGSYGYSGQIQQRPTPSGGGILKGHWFQVIPYDEFLKLCPRPVWDFFIDSAYTASTKNDPSALMAACQHNNNVYIRASAQVFLEFPQLIKEIKSFVAVNGYASGSRIYIEPKASGKSIVQTIKNETKLNVIELEAPDKDKLSRVNSAAPVIESLRVFLISGGWNQNFVEECEAFPNGLHDDQVDNLSACVNKYFGKRTSFASPRLTVNKL